MIKVLLVEDTPRHARVVCNLLAKDAKISKDITVTKSVADTLSALKSAANHDVILLDLELEDSDGLDTLKKVIAADSGIPVVVITSMEDETLAIQAIGLGAQDYLIKGDFTSLQLSTRLHFALERYNLQADLKKYSSAANLLTKAFQQANDPIVITDADGNIEYANQAFSATTQYSLQEIIGKNPRLFKSGKHSAAFYKSLWDTIRAGDPWHGELINKKKSGELHEQELTISPIKDAGGEIAHFVAFLKDVTRQKQIELKLAKIEKEDAENRRELEKLRSEMESQKTVMMTGYSSVSAKMVGLSSLRERSPNLFDKLGDQYGELLDNYMEALAFRQEKPHDKITALADKIGDYTCGPRDVIDIHLEAVSRKCIDVHPARVRALTLEGRLLALELMGHLVDYYRRGGTIKPDYQQA
ncbi:MAG: PAS domain S-box protein [Nitrospinae bacterium]|nr:PAS domain S-box protein [Nitrospinota bacterium]